MLTFARAEIQLGEDLSGVLLQARYTGERFIAEGDELVILDADTLQGGDLTVTVCRCEVPTWDVTARAVTVELDEVARFTGGWIRVCEQRVLPVPAGIVPLAERRSGLLPPRIGYGQDGVIAAQPVFLTLGESADLTAEPEWRQARGLRGRGTLRYALAPGGEGGQLDGALGYDQSQSRWRGAASVQHGWGPGPVWSAVDARYQSDPDYLADYGEDFLSRAAPWMESRALPHHRSPAAGDGHLPVHRARAAATGRRRPLRGASGGTGERVQLRSPRRLRRGRRPAGADRPHPARPRRGAHGRRAPIRRRPRRSPAPRRGRGLGGAGPLGMGRRRGRGPRAAVGRRGRLASPRGRGHRCPGRRIDSGRAVGGGTGRVRAGGMGGGPVGDIALALSGRGAAVGERAGRPGPPRAGRGCSPRAGRRGRGAGGRRPSPGSPMRRGAGPRSGTGSP